MLPYLDVAAPEKDEKEGGGGAAKQTGAKGEEKGMGDSEN